MKAGSTRSAAERAEFATLIYYPKEKLEEIQRDTPDMREWYRITFHRLIELCRLTSSKYTRSKVRKAMPREYAYILDEMLHTHYEDNDKRDYYENIISTIIDIGRASNFLVQLCELIKRLAVDHLHVVGDAFDTSDITVTAILSNKEERKVTTTAAIEYDLDSLGLDDKGKFTQAKEYTLNIAFAGVKTTLTFTVAEA